MIQRISRHLITSYRSYSSKEDLVSKRLIRDIEHMIYHAHMASLTNFVDAEVKHLDKNKIVTKLEEHPWVDKIYVQNGSIRVFAVKPKYPEKSENGTLGEQKTP